MTLRTARFRRIATGTSLIAAPLLMLAGMALTPWEGTDDTRAYLEALVSSPTQAQVAPLFLHYGFALFMPALFGALALLRGRGAGLGHAAAALGVLGLSTIPGFLIIDWYQLAIAETAGVDAAVAVEQRLETYPLFLLLVVPGALGFLGALVLLPVALWRAGVAPVWVPIVAALGFLAGEATPPALPYAVGTTLLVLAAYGYLGLRVLRMDDAQWERGGPGAG